MIGNKYYNKYFLHFCDFIYPRMNSEHRLHFLKEKVNLLFISHDKNNSINIESIQKLLKLKTPIFINELNGFFDISIYSTDYSDFLKINNILKLDVNFHSLQKKEAISSLIKNIPNNVIYFNLLSKSINKKSHYSEQILIYKHLKHSDLPISKYIHLFSNQCIEQILSKPNNSRKNEMINHLCKKNIKLIKKLYDSNFFSKKEQEHILPYLI